MRGGIFPPARPAVLSEAKVLQEGEGNAGHQRMSVQFRPRAPLEVTQPPGTDRILNSEGESDHVV
jgi:hypothetical protein